MTRPYAGVKPSDLEGKPYRKYWNPNISTVPVHVQRALDAGMSDAALTFTPEQADQMLEQGYLPLETGFARMVDGRMFVSCLTKMPGVTAEMIDWWFAWHPMEDERYKLWHPREHMSCRAMKKNADEKGLSDTQKYIGNPHFVTEKIGTEKVAIIISFEDPNKMFDTSRFVDAQIGTAVCASVAVQGTPFVATRMVHLIRDTEDGVEMRSRFWLGSFRFRMGRAGNLLNRLLLARFLARKIFKDDAGPAMLTHCAEEMNNLASFLPDLYRDYHVDSKQV